IEAGSRGTRHVQISVVSKGQMIGGDGGLERGEDVDLPRAADLENRPAPVADVQILFGIASDSGSRPHAFDAGRAGSHASHLVHRAVVAAGNVQRALVIESQTLGG